MTLLVKQFPCLHDNYGFLVHDPDTRETATIDTPDAEVILEAAREANWPITQIWNTHHHHDHIGGNDAIREATGARIVGPATETHRIPHIDQHVHHGETVELGTSQAQVIETPGHTLGHVAYHFPNDGIVFVGDTLFAMGCGRLFEGTAEQMWQSLSGLLALPDNTTVYCAHEYTLANAKFCLTIEPENTALQVRAADVSARRERNEPTVPTTIRLERETNAFVRAHSPEIRARLGLEGASDVDVFAEIRRRKDSF